DTTAKAKKFFEEAEAFYKKKQYANAAEKYKLAYQNATGDQRGSIAFNVAQSYRLSNKFPPAAVWYQKALDLGGPSVNQYRDEIEQRIAEMLGEARKDPKTLGEAQMLFEQAQMAYDDGDYAKAEPLYKEAYERSGLPGIAFNIAQCCRLGGKYGDAKDWDREFPKLDPKSASRAEGEERTEEMKKKAPDPPDLTSTDDAKKKFEEADRLYKAGKYSEAADYYAEVYYDPAVAFARGQVAFNMGQCMRLTG